MIVVTNSHGRAYEVYTTHCLISGICTAMLRTMRNLQISIDRYKTCLASLWGLVCTVTSGDASQRVLHMEIAAKPFDARDDGGSNHNHK